MPVESLSTRLPLHRAHGAIISAVSAAVSFGKRWELQGLLCSQWPPAHRRQAGDRHFTGGTWTASLQRLLLFSGSLPLKASTLRPGIFMENHIKRAIHVHNSRLPAGEESSKTEVVTPFSFLIALSKWSRDATVSDVYEACLPPWKYLFWAQK